MWLAGKQAEADSLFRQILGRGRGRLIQPETRMEVYTIKVTLLGTNPPIWRRFLVPRDITLSSLHRTLQTLMGWTNSHLHQFVWPRQRHGNCGHVVDAKIANENRTKLGELIWTVGATLLYEYDFGDGWQLELLLEKVSLGDESFQQICVAGKRCGPPEDCGGPSGFAELLIALKDANHPDHEEVAEWVGDFVPELFSVEEINRQLRRWKH